MKKKIKINEEGAIVIGFESHVIHRERSEWTLWDPGSSFNALGHRLKETEKKWWGKAIVYLMEIKGKIGREKRWGGQEKLSIVAEGKTYNNYYNEYII